MAYFTPWCFNQPHVGGRNTCVGVWIQKAMGHARLGAPWQSTWVVGVLVRPKGWVQGRAWRPQAPLS